MAVRRPITWVDVFTATPLTGNGLAVVHDADGIDDDTMLAFARETRLSETTFIQSSGEGADYRNRIWTMAGEIAFAGHPSLGTAVAVARARGTRNASFVQETIAGRQPVEVRLGDEERARASMLQEPPEFAAEAPAGEVMPVAGLFGSDGDPRFPPQVVSTGIKHLIAPVRAEALDRAAPARADLRALLEPLGALVLYLVAFDPAAGTARARGFFLDPAGVTEDPATGSAAGPLLAYLHERAGTEELTVHQGAQIGRPGVIECRWEEDRPRVAGNVVVVAEGHVTF
ncbi:MAG: trans-2,3-dihydro-3-hydroxyanthranilate isomerase [Solirubrobacteraceae bacterium]|jgi:trans-2,3-dihydro-3-hydroxyanthranilate isomerase|nr:trans-2,3-dihydro-3-hydroxyanthranilate isomerase [Solirubrobacteraceae bacterium]